MAKYPHLEMNLEPHMTVNTLTATENNYMTTTRNRFNKNSIRLVSFFCLGPASDESRSFHYNINGFLTE